MREVGEFEVPKGVGPVRAPQGSDPRGASPIESSARRQVAHRGPTRVVTLCGRGLGWLVAGGMGLEGEKGKKNSENLEKKIGAFCGKWRKLRLIGRGGCHVRGLCEWG